MKNIQGTKVDLIITNSLGVITYKFLTNKNGFTFEALYDAKGNILIYKNSDGFYCEWEYNSKNEIIYYRDNEGSNKGFDINSDGEIIGTNNELLITF